MGANAVTTVPVYVAGEVLTAADMNITNSGIPVFADSTARDAAFGGTGEKTLAEGQFAYLEDTNTTQYYDGATWQSVGTTPGLVFITGATFSAAASVSLPTSTFTSTYTNYKIVFRVSAASGTFTLTSRLRASGTDNTTSNYSTASPGLFSNAAATTISGYNATSFANDTATNATGLIINVDVLNPQATDLTQITGNLIGFNPLPAIAGYSYNAQFGATTSFDSMSFIAATSTITGYYKVYGYSNS
jgi:hypothetical protein